MNSAVSRQHATRNLLQSFLLVVVLLAICGLGGYLIFGPAGFGMAVVAGLLALLLQPAAATRMTLRLYRARALRPDEAPGLWRMLALLAERAGLPSIPVPHHVPSPMVNAFAVGSRRASAIALTDGLLRRLDVAELNGVLAHEVAHIAHGDLRVMGLADYVSRITAFFALAAQLYLLLSLPALLAGSVQLNWLAMAVLLLSPQLALLAQLGLSRVREFEADRAAAELTGDPDALARALMRIERVTRSWRAWLMPGWGNPEPSWLRTHPLTEERVDRLRQMLPPQKPLDAFMIDEFSEHPERHRPRWFPGGFWY